MPIAKIQLPDGRIAKFDVPEGTTPEQVMVFAQAQMKSAQPQAHDPTDGMSTTEKALAGIGKAFYDVGRGAGQLVGLVSRKDVEDARQRDAALMNTDAGKWGNIGGNMAMLAPTALIPGANTLAGSAVIGAASGLLQPSASTKETLSNVGVGAVTGPLANIAGRAIGAAYQGGKSLVEPFFKQGQDKIAARTLQRFSADPQASAAAARAATTTATGAQPTLAEATKDAGLAQLQRALQSADPDGFATSLANRIAGNNAARVNALRQIAGDDAAMTAAVDARESAANALYGKAFASDAMRKDLSKSAQQARAPFSGVGVSALPDDLATPGLRELSKRPMFQQAAQAAKELAANNGVTLKDPVQSLEGLHYIKLALDDMANPTAATAMGKNANAAVNDMRAKLAEELAQVSPLYGNARQTFADMSKPINQMDVGRRLLGQYASATSDLSGNPRLRAEAFNRALQNEDKLLKAATGFKGANKLADVMTPDQMKTIQAIADEIGLQSAVADAGKAVGSNTAQNLASQNVLRQLLGPTGLPQTWSENALLATLMRPAQFVAKAAEPKITNRLANAMLNPQEAAALLEMANNPTVSQRFGARALPWLAPVTVGAQRAEALK